MKITKSTLKKLIKEEMEKALSEGGMFRNAQQYASRHMLPFCEAGWSISNSNTLWRASGAGRTPWEEIVQQADQWLRKHGPEGVAKTFGLTQFRGQPSDCAEMARQPRR